MNTRMPGKFCPDGPGGRDCNYCGARTINGPKEQ